MCALQDYPAQPFFLRVISPRCVWYTGHVTAGGSICIEALTLSGGPNGWSSALCVESVLNLVVTNMCVTAVLCTLDPPLIRTLTLSRGASAWSASLCIQSSVLLSTLVCASFAHGRPSTFRHLLSRTFLARAYGLWTAVGRHRCFP